MKKKTKRNKIKKTILMSKKTIQEIIRTRLEINSLFKDDTYFASIDLTKYLLPF